MRTIVGSSTKNTKDIKKAERIVNLDPNKLPVPTNVSQYGAGGSDIKDLETAKHWASAAEKSAKDAKNSADKAEDFYEKVVEAADDVLNNTEDSHNYLKEIREISIKIDGQETNIEALEKSTVEHAATAEAAAQIASDSATQARISEANAAASASSANNSAVSAKESEQKAKASEIAADLSATKADQTLAQTEAVYDKTIDDVSQAVQSYLKDKGGFDPASGLPVPDSWLNIFGERKNLSCLWTADVAGTIPETGVGFNQGDVLLYNAIVDRYGRFSGELVTGGGGGGPTEFFNDIKLSADKRLLGTDSKGSTVELIKLVNDIVEAGDKTKPMHILARDTKSAFVCVANATRGFDNYEIYHTGNIPTAADVGAHSKAEADAKFLDLAGTKAMSGPLNTTNTIYVKTKEVYHPGNKPPAGDLDAVSLTKNETVSGQKKFTKNPIVEGISPQISLAESDTNTTVDVKVESKKLTMSTPTSTPFDVDFNNSSVLMSNPKSKTTQGTTADALVRKDYADAELAKKMDKTGGSFSGDVIVKGKITVEGTGSLFADINTTGQVKENNIRVYSPANKPNAIDVGALPVSGGSVGGALHVVGNITTDGTISEKGQRVYSPNNKPTPAALGAVNKAGDTMAGDLQLSHGSATPLILNRTSGDNLNIKFSTSGKNYFFGTAADGFFRVGTTNNLLVNGTKIYHEGFKPTAADIGAIGIENVYDKTQADARFWQRTETVNRSFSTDAVNSYGQTSAGSYKDTAGFRTYITSAGGTGFPAELGSGFFQGRLSGVNNYGWSMFNPVNSSHFYAGHQKADGSGFNWFKLYHEGNKPSAGDIDTYTKSEIDSKDNLKLNLTGGTITGNLKVTNSIETNGAVVDKRIGSNPQWMNATTSLLILGNNTSVADLRFETGSNGKLTHKKGTTVYDLYTTGNKPAAVDVGALPITGGAMTGSISFSGNFSPLAFNHTASGSSIGVDWTDNFLRFRCGTNNTALGISLSNYDTHVVQLRRSGHVWAQNGMTVGSSNHNVYHAGNLLFSKTPDADKLVQRDTLGSIQAKGVIGSGVFRTITNPSGGQFRGETSNTGSIQIKLPTLSSGTMLKLHVSVYNYASDTSFNAVISGYDFSGATWHNCSAIITGASNTPSHPVYYGNDGTKACIWIGVVGAKWSYVHVTIDKIEVGYAGGASTVWDKGYEVSIVPTLGNTLRTISDCLIKPSDAANIADTEPTANTIVRRSGTGGGAFKGRVLIASSNDTDVAAGTASLDFTSASGTVYGQIGDIDTTNQLSVRSESPIKILTLSSSAQKLCAGGLLASDVYADASKIPTNGIYSKGDVTIGGFLNVATSKLSISGVNVIGTDANLVRIGDSGFARTMYLNAKNGEVNVRSDGSTAYRVYHEGFKPTAANVGALPITGGTLTGNSLSIPCNAALQGLSLIDGGNKIVNLSAGYNGHAVLYASSTSNYTKNGFIIRSLTAEGTGLKDLFKVDMAGEIYAGGNQKVFHTGNLPSAGALNTYTKTEIDTKVDAKFDKVGGNISGIVHITPNSSNLKVGGTTGGFTGVIGGKRQKKVGDTSTLDYGTYWAYDASVDDAGTWSAVRSSLGRKWVVDMGYHNDGFRVRTFTGDATATWDDTAWTDILQATSSTLTFKGNNVYHAANKPNATDVGLSYLSQASSEGLVITLNGKRTSIGSRNTTWSHFDTDATDGFYFYKNINASNLSSRGTVGGTILDATGVASGQGLAFNGKTAVGGVSDAWLRLNPFGQFSSGVYCGTSGTLRHDKSVQVGGWSSSANRVAKIQSEYADVPWASNGVAAFSVTQPDTSSAHWLLASYYDGTNIRSGIQVLSNSNGNMRFYTNRRGGYVDIGGSTITGTLSGNASSATKLATARKIAGVAFDGTADISITAANVGAEPAQAVKVIDKTLTFSTSWTDTGITSDDLTTGTYVVNVLTTSTAGGFYSETFAGIMQMYSGGTNSTSGTEIVLTNCGHADGGHSIYLQVLRAASSAGGKVKLQIKSSKSLTSQGLKFTFKRLL